jgi:hypothetical protein
MATDGTWTHETKLNGMVVSTVTGRDEDKRVTFHLGWQMHGDFTAKLNINNSPIQVV